MDNVELSDDGQIITLISDAGVRTRFHTIWLRDNAWDVETRSAGNGQRLIALRDIPEDLRIDSAGIAGTTLRLHFQPEAKSIDYDLDWLMAHSYDSGSEREAGWLAEAIETWDNGLMSAIPLADFNLAKADSSVLRGWLS